MACAVIYLRLSDLLTSLTYLVRCDLLTSVTYLVCTVTYLRLLLT